MTGTPELPAGWAWSTVAEVGEVQLGRQRAPQYHTGKNMRPYLRVANVFEDRIDTTDVMSMDFEPEEFERYRLVPGDILLNEGQSPELLGRPAMYRGVPSSVAFTNSLIRFRPYPGVDPEWALIVFRHYMWSGRFTREARITTNIAHLSANRFKTVEFPVPPLEEQRRIVEALGAHLSQVEAAAKAVGSTATKLSTLRRAILSAAAHGVLVESPAGDVDGLLAAVASARGTVGPKLVEPHAEPYRVPEGWARVSLDSLVAAPRKMAYGVLQPGPDTPRGVPFVRVGDINGGKVATEGLKHIDPEIAEKYPRTRLQGGELLMTLVGTIGRVGVAPAKLAGANVARAVAVIPLVPEVNAHFVALMLQAEPYASAAAGRAHEVARKTLNLEDVRALPVPLPDRKTQDRIVAEVDRRLTAVSAASGGLDKMERRCQALRRSVLAAAVGGRLGTRDPSDEPAELLLKRLAAEREDRPSARRRRPRTVPAARASADTHVVEESA